MFTCQILSKEEYACWLQRHLQAETAIQGREELLYESALRLETNLHLLGNYWSYYLVTKIFYITLVIPLDIYTSLFCIKS